MYQLVKRTSLLIALVAALAAVASQARADDPADPTFNFTDEYYVSTLAQFHTDFGSTQTGFINAGIYQQINPTTVVQLTAHGTGFQNVPGEFVSGDSTRGIVLNYLAENPSTGKNSIGYNFPAPGSTGSGPFINTGGSMTIQYKTGITGALNMTGGNAQPFTLNSISLGTYYPGIATGYTVSGFLNGVLEDSMTISSNNTYNFINGSQTGILISTPVTFNWTNIDEVAISPMTQVVLCIDNISITPFAAIPEPSRWVGLTSLGGMGLIGLVGMIWRRRRG